MRVSASTTAKTVATQWHGHRPVPACDFQGLFREGSRDALLGQHFEHFIGTRPEPRFHRFLHDLDKSVATFVTRFDQSSDDSANISHRFVHVGRVVRPSTFVNTMPRTSSSGFR